MDGLDNAQAAISVVTNTTDNKLNWIGLVMEDSVKKWETLHGDNPTAGQEYDIQIALDNRDGHKKIRYSVRAGAGAYTVLTNSSGTIEGWFGNPQGSVKDSVSAVAFAGAGKVGDFSSSSIVDDDAGIGSLSGVHGFDFTNGVVNAEVTVPSGSGNRTAVLRVVDTNGTAHESPKAFSSSETLSWNLEGVIGSSLTPGATYYYTVSVKSGDAVREVKAGSFTAANLLPDWFGVAVVNSQAVTNNGTLAGAEFSTDKWTVASDALFEVTDIAPGSNAVSRVDTVYAFETFIDSESLESLDVGAVGGIVAVSDGGSASWYAYTGNGDAKGWAELSGGVVPETNVEYVVRAEFDFKSATHYVRYLVSSDNGNSFFALTLGGNQWIELASQTPGSLSSVGMSGKGYVKSISANVADTAVVQDSTGKKFATVWEAVRDGTGPFTLLTNATFAPTGAAGRFKINKSGYQIIDDASGLTGKWIFKDLGDGSYILMKPGATYIFF